MKAPLLFGTAGVATKLASGTRAWVWGYTNGFQARITAPGNLSSRSRWSFWFQAGTSKGHGYARDLDEAQQGLTERLNQARARWRSNLDILDAVIEGKE